MKRIGTIRYVSRARMRWYLARGWRRFDLGPYHGQFSVGMWKPA
jgi:hypothetical protein